MCGMFCGRLREFTVCVGVLRSFGATEIELRKLRAQTCQSRRDEAEASPKFDLESRKPILPPYTLAVSGCVVTCCPLRDNPNQN